MSEIARLAIKEAEAQAEARARSASLSSLGLIEAERTIRAMGISRMHCSMDRDGVTLAAERPTRGLVYGRGGDLASAMQSLLRAAVAMGAAS